MTIQHRNIPDAERHDVKGAGTATAGQVLASIGAGSTSFVNPNTLSNITISSTLESSNLTSQSPSAVDTVQQVVFGSASSDSNVSIATDGTITFLTAGVYLVNLNLNFGRTTNTGIAIVVARVLINDVFSGFVYASKIDTSINIHPFSTTLLRPFSISDTIKVQIIRDSVGTNDGGLITFDPVLSGWANAPSAAVRVQKITGAS